MTWNHLVCIDIKSDVTRGVDSFLKIADSLSLKLNKVPPVGSDFHEALEERSVGKHLQIHTSEI